MTEERKAIVSPNAIALARGGERVAPWRMAISKSLLIPMLRKSSRLLSGPRRRVRTQRLEQRRQVFFIAAPALQGAAIDRSAHLDRTGCLHRPRVFVRSQAALVPRQSAKREQAFDLALRVRNQFLV